MNAAMQTAPAAPVRFVAREAALRTAPAPAAIGTLCSTCHL
jgi:hypothetical protein